MTLQSMRGELAPWFHNLHLPGGVQTAPDHPLGDFPAFKWRQLERCVPPDLTGLRALDIGCNAGFYSFELARRGAEVLAVDVDEHYLRQARWAAEQLDPERRVEFRQMHVYDLDGLDGRFDIVLFLGVLYHLRHPLLALDLVAERVGGRLFLQTLTMPGEPPRQTPPDLDVAQRRRLTETGWPRAAFIEHSLADDPTNWWVPDDACVRAMVRSAGLRVTAAPGHELYVCEPDPEHDDGAERRGTELRAARGGESMQRVGSGAPPRSFEIARGAVPAALVDDALRLLHLDLLERGASAEELGQWLWGTHWFPHLRDHDAISALADALPAAWRTGTFCEPQILLQFPHVGPEPEITFHVDREPDWADGRRYARIVGVALSPWRRENGGLLVDGDGGPTPVELDPGDAVMMAPDLPHSGGVNHTGALRYGVYFRWLRPTGQPPNAAA